MHFEFFWAFAAERFRFSSDGSCWKKSFSLCVSLHRVNRWGTVAVRFAVPEQFRQFRFSLSVPEMRVATVPVSASDSALEPS